MDEYILVFCDSLLNSGCKIIPKNGECPGALEWGVTTRAMASPTVILEKKNPKSVISIVRIKESPDEKKKNL